MLGTGGTGGAGSGAGGATFGIDAGRGVGNDGGDDATGGACDGPGVDGILAGYAGRPSRDTFVWPNKRIVGSLGDSRGGYDGVVGERIIVERFTLESGERGSEP